MKTDQSVATASSNDPRTVKKPKALVVRTGISAGFFISGWGDVGMKSK